MRQTTSLKPKWRVLKSQTPHWPLPKTITATMLPEQGRLIPYIAATLMVTGLTLLFWNAGYVFTLVNIALLYLLPVLIIAVRWGLWPSFYAAVIGVLAFDFFYVPPIFKFTVGDIRYLISFAVYLAVATFTASLASQLRQRVKEAIAREAITSALYALSTQVAATSDLDTVLQEIVHQAFTTFGLSAAIVLPIVTGELRIRAQDGLQKNEDFDMVEPRILRWVYEHGQIAGFGTNHHRDTPMMYVPLKTESQTHGVMCIGAEHQSLGSATQRIRVAQALASLAAVSVARIHFEEEAKIAHLTAESERLRTALLDSISHELRTPLAAIIGAATGMIESEQILTDQDRRELLLTVREGAMRMNRLVTNLLGMVRLESGMLRLNKQWSDVSDIIGVALRQVQDSLQHRSVEITMPNTLPDMAVDDILIEQVLVNLLSNAIKYSPDESFIYIDVKESDGSVTISIRDKGIGIQPAEAEKIFDKFYRSQATRNIPGTGLGLAICKGIIVAHGGEISARRAKEIGTVVSIRLPLGEIAYHKETT